jgi:hypothetical protein
MVKRQLLWYCSASEPPINIFEWNILLINTLGEIEGIKQKLYGQLAPVEEERQIRSGLIPNSGGLHYELTTLVSTIPEINFQKIYKGKGKAKKDRRLQPKKTPEGWSDLIEKAASGNI